MTTKGVLGFCLLDTSVSRPSWHDVQQQYQSEEGWSLAAVAEVFLAIS